MGKRFSFWLLLFLSGAGFFIAIYLSHHHYTLSFGKELSFQLCRGGCDTVNTSSYSEFFGIPIASYGAIAYFNILILACFGLLLDKITLAFFFLSLILLIALFCLATSFVLAGISIFKLFSFCSLCSYTYLINFLMVWVSGRILKTPSGTILKTVRSAWNDVLKRQDFTQNPEKYYQRLAMILICLVLFLSTVSGFTISFFQSEKYRVLSGEKLQKFIEDYTSMPRVTVTAHGSPTKGSQNPKLTLAVFSNFVCRHCRNASFVFDRLLPEYQKKLQIVYKHLPFDEACNPYYKERTSPNNSCRLSMASICAQERGKFWEYHDLLYEPPQAVAEEKLVSLAQKVGIEKESFEKCMEDPKTKERLLSDIHEANRLGVNSTPTFFLNGKRVQGLPPTPILHTLIQREIQ